MNKKNCEDRRLTSFPDSDNECSLSSPFCLVLLFTSRTGVHISGICEDQWNGCSCERTGKELERRVRRRMCRGREWMGRCFAFVPQSLPDCESRTRSSHTHSLATSLSSSEKDADPQSSGVTLVADRVRAGGAENESVRSSDQRGNRVDDINSQEHNSQTHNRQT